MICNIIFSLLFIFGTELQEQHALILFYYINKAYTKITNEIFINFFALCFELNAKISNTKLTILKVLAKSHDRQLSTSLRQWQNSMT